MALVLFFVPGPALAVAEMCRAVRPGGVVAAYHWDILGGGFPLADIAAEMLKLGVPPRLPPSAAASTIEAVHFAVAGGRAASGTDLPDHRTAPLRKFR